MNEDIDWNLEERQINSNRLTDSEVSEALRLLDIAKKYVEDISKQVKDKEEKLEKERKRLQKLEKQRKMALGSNESNESHESEESHESHESPESPESVETRNWEYQRGLG